jgi:3-dehydroquinate synthase
MLPIKSTDYSVFFDDDLSSLKNFLVKPSFSRVFFVTDLNTSEHCLPFLLNSLQDVLNEYDIVEVDPGEENKNIDYCIGIWRRP